MLFLVQATRYLKAVRVSVLRRGTRRLFEVNGLIRSMSRSGNLLDNAVAERFFRTLKSECQVNWREMTAREVRWNIAGYIEMFYNSERLHSYNGYLSPNEYEKKELVLV